LLKLFRWVVRRMNLAEQDAARTAGENVARLGGATIVFIIMVLAFVGM